MAKIGKIDTECKLRTSYYLSAAAGGGGFNIKIYLISPLPPKALYNSNDPPLIGSQFSIVPTLHSVGDPPLPLRSPWKTMWPPNLLL